jgi:hypothetical protein
VYVSRYNSSKRSGQILGNMLGYGSSSDSGNTLRYDSGKILASDSGKESGIVSDRGLGKILG